MLMASFIVCFSLEPVFKNPHSRSLHTCSIIYSNILVYLHTLIMMSFIAVTFPYIIILFLCSNSWIGSHPVQASLNDQSTVKDQIQFASCWKVSIMVEISYLKLNMFPDFSCFFSALASLAHHLCTGSDSWGPGLLCCLLSFVQWDACASRFPLHHSHKHIVQLTIGCLWMFIVCILFTLTV